MRGFEKWHLVRKMFRRKEQPKSEKEPLQIKNMTDTMDSS